MLAARAWLQWRARPPGPRDRSAWLGIAIAACLVLWVLHSPGGWILGEVTWVLALAALAAIFLALVARGLPWAHGLLSSRPLAFAGRVSYSAYLYHLPLLFLWNLNAPALTGWWLALPLYLVAVFSISWLSYRYVELRERVPTSIAAPIASTCNAATPQRTWAKRPESMSMPNAIGAMASPVSIPE